LTDVSQDATARQRRCVTQRAAGHMEPSREACSIRHGEPVALGVPRILAVRLEASALAPSRQTQRRGL